MKIITNNIKNKKVGFTFSIEQNSIIIISL